MDVLKLPIADFENEICNTVADNPVTIVVADTGAGKSTQVPKYLVKRGWELVVTQPRRLAARTVAARVAFEMGEELGQTIGVRTRDDRIVGPRVRCLFATDGLALVRELLGVKRRDKTILVIDEVHEWNLNIEVLVAWCKLQLSRGADFKVVLMSATLEAEKLSAYFDNAPIISVPGRLYPVKEETSGRDLETDVASLLAQGRNVLVFQPGKAEIAETLEKLGKMGVNAELIPLHGELQPGEQALAFKSYARPKCVVATNVAQTSITIDDIDAVVDAGVERRTEIVDGVEGLYVRPISFADSKQRAGRAGRTKPGVYIDHCSSASRLEFPVAEILRRRLDQTVLRLAEAGFDAEELEFFHQPDHEAIHEAKRALKALGCMETDGSVSRKGKRVSLMPCSVEAACMVIEADRLRVVDDILTVAAIMEAGGDIMSRRDEQNFPSFAWRSLCPDERESDVLAQLAAFKLARTMQKPEMRRRGIHAKAYFKAVEARRHLAESLRGKVGEFRSSGDREKIMKAVCAGMVDHLYRYELGLYKNGDEIPRQLNRDSFVMAADWLVGQPWDLQIKTKQGPRVLKLVRFATKVKPEWLAEVAPQLVERKTGLNPRFDAMEEMVVSTTELYFNGRKVLEETVPDPEHPQAAALERDYRNEAQWNEWARPRLQAPDLLLERFVMPSISVQAYGVCVSSGATLLAYGVLRGSVGWMRTNVQFITEWHREREVAERVQTETLRLVEAAREALRDEKNLSALKAEAAALYPAFVSLYTQNGSNRALDANLRRRLEEHRFNYSLMYTSAQIRGWIATARAITQEVEQALRVSREDLPKVAPAALQQLDVSQLFGGVGRASRSNRRS